ncbi:hypothetical protein QQS21_004809 [Conoideocrella luteorostrata]|uniref:Uncharacterized protein n=1 Tax=Conoideocrella luteorostrata TaxID=1105319 RepID=A0AAJ0CUV4_9HYPO|nr:hypothetical protein QQS21_004809 [Conoideocrella luteorostrata]
MFQDKNEDPEVRSSAADALRNSAVRGLLALLQNKDLRIRNNTAKVLNSQLNLSNTAIAGIITLLQDEDPDVPYHTTGALQGQSNLLDKIFEAMGLLLESEPLTKSTSIAFLNHQVLKWLYGELLFRSFSEQLTLHFESNAGVRSCIINQPGGVRTASIEESGVNYQLYTTLDDGMQLWNIYGYKLGDKLWDHFREWCYAWSS